MVTTSVSQTNQHLPSHEEILEAARSNSAQYLVDFLIQSTNTVDLFKEFDRLKQAGYDQVELKLAADYPGHDLDNSPVVKGMRRNMRTKATKEAKAEFFKKHNLTKMPSTHAWGLNAGTGVGKTTAAIEALKNNPAGTWVDIYEPTLAKGEELLEDLRAQGLEADIERGMSAHDPDHESRQIDRTLLKDYHTPELMCVQYNAVAEASKHQVQIGEQFCKTCPFAGECGFHKQRGPLRAVADKNGIIVKTHARMKYSSVVDNSAIAIVDEDPSRSSVEEATISKWLLSEKSLTKLCGNKAAGCYEQIQTVVSTIDECLSTRTPTAVLTKEQIGHYKTLSKIMIGVFRSTRPDLDGQTDPVKIVEMLEGQYSKAPTVKRFLDQIVQAANKGVTLNSLCVSGDEIKFSFTKVASLGKKSNVIYLSANLRGQRLEANCGRKVKIKTFDVPKNVRIEHIKTKASIASLTGKNPDGTPISKLSIARAKNKLDKIIEMSRDIIGEDAKTLVVSNSTVEQAFNERLKERWLDEGPGSWDQRHFGELEGLNQYKDHDAMLIIGQAWPAVQVIERMGAAVALSKRKSIVTIADWLRDHPGVLLDTNGFIATPQGPWHPDPFVRDEIDVLVSDSIDQAIGRLRAVNSPIPKVVVMVRNHVPVGFVDLVDQGADHDDVGTPKLIDIYSDRMQNQKLFPITPTAMKAAAPDLFATANAAKTARTTSRANGGSFPISIKTRDLYRDWPEYKWRVDWKFPGRGSARQTAIAKREVVEGDVVAMFDRKVKGFSCVPIVDDRPDHTVPDPEHDETSVNASADEVAVMTSLGRNHLTKEFDTVPGFITPVKKEAGYPTWYRAEKRRIASLHDLYDLMKEIEGDPNTAIARGDILPTANRERMKRTYLSQDPTMIDSPNRLCVLDIDDYVLPDGVRYNGPADLKRVIKAVARALPEPFKSSRFIVRASSSMGITSEPHIAKLHFWFLLKTPMTGSDLRLTLADLMNANPGCPQFDLALANAVQLASTARPVCNGFDDPIAKRTFMVITPGLEEYVDLKPSKPRIERVYEEDVIEREMSDQYFEDAVTRIGEGGIHQTTRAACWHAVKAIQAGKISRQYAIQAISNRVRSLPAGHRTAKDMEERANPRKIDGMLRWHEQRIR